MKIIKRLPVFVAIVFLPYIGFGQVVPAILDSILNKTLDSMQVVLNVKSLSAAMQFTDSSVWARASGISSVFPTVNVTTNDVYLIGSITKTITAACILQLTDQGILNLDDSLYMWLDTIQYINPNITIRQLLRNQSGIYDVLSNPACQPALIANPDSIWAPEDLIITFIQPAIFQPGNAWSYSNTNYFLLGMIIKEATGNFFYQEFRNRFFTPLGMNTIAIPAYETLTSPVAHVWIDLNGDGITDDANTFYMNYLALNSVAGAAGGYFATPTDITKWMRTYMRGDLITPAMMLEAQTTVSAPGLPGTTYGLGLMKKTFLGYQGFGHGGDLAYAASSWYFGAKDVSITVFTNDSKNNSWTLVPVVTALLKSYTDYCTFIMSSSPEIPLANLKWSVFPNPFNEKLSVSINSGKIGSRVELVLTNVLGEKIVSQTQPLLAVTDQIIQLNNIEKLTAGIYYLTLSIDGNPKGLLKVIK